MKTKYSTNIRNELHDERLLRKFYQRESAISEIRHLPDFLAFNWKYVNLNKSDDFEDFLFFFFGNIWKYLTSILCQIKDSFYL